MKTLIILDHPSYDLSVVNRRWVDEVRKYPDDFALHNLQSSYPRSSIDAANEHSLIDNAAAVVLQFPIFWYNCPPMMKAWIDTVFSPGWAYAGGRHLEGKPMALAVTCGGAQADYTPDGANAHTIEEFLCPFVQAVKRVHADFKGIYTFYGAHPADGSKPNVTELAASARNYVDFLHSLTGKAPAAVSEQLQK
ncbi:MAG: NAD(P)H-dependent oxidoreductase [Proteobacteria bacterium]|uniref:NAD(P)H-dependent oxidoreductase n=1 Tax=Candidatus Avisuccinivibrio stercorigallinarum TaxID=2840704 RepID=A0A9D9DA03_9GAMM|nr:NAD(P)H-dependent oxidoreductase [Candidatus Avisuccinivibrio stercorigallinarum]